MTLIAGLIAAGVFVGWIIGHYATPGHTKTVTVAAGQTAVQSGNAITPAPAFSTSDLAADPTDMWATNGGSYMNQRYSPLDQIDTGNIGKVKGVWMTHLDGSALAAKYSGESQPLEFDGVIYVPTGEDDVFAVSADTGKILWKYSGNLDQTISVVCCGWESRGVALGEGKVYLGKLDGSIVALDQQTGKQVWRTVIEPWQKGYSVTSAPLYVDGMIITGVSGGEFGIRGRLTALDAKTGKLKWRFWTTAPGTWGGNAYLHGGAPIWQTPSVDPKLGLLYFTTGNANPDNDGSKRPGKNLYAASFVALDIKTGKLKWYYQMVHHDIWDYDAPSPTVLFDTTINGKTVHGIGEAEKTGWLYLLDRATGKPLFPTPEKAVPQMAEQKTYPTQPIPSYAPFVPHTLSDTQFNELQKLVQAAAKGKKVTLTRATQMYTPFWHNPVALTPGPQGGTNWQPSSYNPNTHMFYVCAQSGVTADTADTAAPAKQKSAVAQDTIGSTLTIGGGFGQNVGTFSAIDATTGKIVWQKRWAESCYAGSTTTKGNLVFIGRNDGRLQAYDARNGKLVWNWQMGAGANDAPTIFQRNGKEYIAFYAAGNALAASPHGDNLWLLGLDGTMKPAAAPGAGSGIQHAGAGNKGQQGNQNSSAGDATAGKTIFAANCTPCHGATGHGGNGGPDLTSIPSAKQLTVVVGQVTNGGGGMPPFKGQLSTKQINDVATYVVQDITHGSTSGK